MLVLSARVAAPRQSYGSGGAKRRAVTPTLKGALPVDCDHAASGQDRHAGTELADVLHDVRGEHHDHSLADLAEQIMEAVPLFRIEPRRGLIDDDQSRISEERLRDAEPPTHAARERVHRLSPVLIQVGAMEERVEPFKAQVWELLPRLAEPDRPMVLMRRMQTFDDKTRSTVDAMAYSASVGLTSHLDQVLFPTPGTLHPNQILSNLDQYRMYDPWLALHHEGKTTIRLQMNFLQNQNDPALPELKERLRNQFQYFGDDMLMTGSIGEWAAPLASGAVWREAQRLVAQLVGVDIDLRQKCFPAISV